MARRHLSLRFGSVACGSREWKNSPAACRNRRQRPGRLVVVLGRNHVVVGHVYVGQGTVQVGAGDHPHAAILDRGLVDGEPAAAQLHGPDRPVGGVLVHTLGGADFRGLEQHAIAEHLDVRPQDASQHADDVGVAAARLEQVVRLHQPVDLADAVARMTDAQLVASNAGLDLPPAAAPGARTTPPAKPDSRSRRNPGCGSGRAAHRSTRPSLRCRYPVPLP